MRGLTRTSGFAIGVDVGDRQIKAVQLGRAPDGWRVEASGVIPRTSEGPFVEPDEVRRLGDMFKQKAFKGTSIVLAAPREKLLTATLELPPRDSGAPIDTLARSELSRRVQCAPQSFEMACWDLPAPNRAGAGSPVMAVACLHDDADAVLDVFEAGGLQVQRLDTHLSAVARALLPVLKNVSGVTGVLDIGWNDARVIFLHEGVVVYERTLGANGMVAAIATMAAELQVDAETAEHLLAGRDPTPGPAGDDAPAQTIEQVHAASAAYFAELVKEIRPPLSYMANQYSDAAVERLLLTGDGASMPGLYAHLVSSLDLDVRAKTGPALTVARGLAIPVGS